ncbi:hypothetical protein MJO28_008144 [Puccinia striiformis f. sp. tritici]|uniref:Uncharacterized protein n=3 Tax=Puccinia striiformis TaxID=27350 RepID=A0A0L0VFF3_9BASI|nr:hypothetical protein Pst134EA_015797 [Puccinia striiformis f. sp. tritici]KAI9602495.1 hypothetical protein H4Q26_001784 [Puccinia striiformis f. sp. tritici PST-130]KNE98015.1 hypothetical protein PSTG_08688 [Puccinia striiformis f. sp. tritici PST-78]POW05928.1 hypothetical protein PSTT_09353 [Puccinia striiformis]KAH9452949.1 hypothetical protein Pst134EB_016890 [Puccinia striiformis f. sp. tritici]KAH9463711.1 hypothetical protein Pst134EA_015797 [Puccinia striiformis f. sp. tritici]
MAGQSAFEPVAEMIAGFRQINLNKKSERDYKAIFKQAIVKLHERVLTHDKRTINNPTLSNPIRAPPGEISHTGSGIVNKMARVILPTLKERLKLLPPAMNPTTMRSGSPKWFEEILDNLIAIDKLLEQIDSSVNMIWRVWKPNQDKKRSIHYLSYSRINTIACGTYDLLTGPLDMLLLACIKFFDNFSFSTPSSDNHTIAQRWDDVATRTNTSIEHLDRLIQHMQKPYVAVAKDEMQELVDQIDVYIKSLVKHLNYPWGQESESDEDIQELSVTGRKYVRNGIPVIKLCRVFFNKLSRSTNSQPLIFDGPGMKMEDSRVKDLLVYNKEAKRLIYEFTDEVKCTPSHRQNAETVSINIMGGLIDCWGVVEDYWKSLLASNDPRVDKEAIADARRWLESFTKAWFSATTTMAMATGWQGPGSSAYD